MRRLFNLITSYRRQNEDESVENLSIQLTTGDNNNGNVNLKRETTCILYG